MRILKYAAGLLGLGVIVLAVPAPLAAQTALGTYTFNGNGATSFPSYPNLTYTGFTLTNVALNQQNNVHRSNGWTTGGSIDTGEYISFTVTPATGYQIQVDSLDFNASRSSTGPTTLQVRHSADSYAAGPTNHTVATSNGSFSSDFTDFNATSTLTFRIFGWSASAANGTLTLDNVSVMGEVQPRASLNTSVTAPGARVVLGSTANFNVSVQNNALSGGTVAAEGLDYSLALGGTSGVSLVVPSSGTGLASGSTANHSLAVDTSTLGLKGGGNVTVSSTNAYRANGTVGSGSANLALDTVAVVDNRTISATNVDLGRVVVGVTSAGQATTVSSTQIDSEATRVTLGLSNKTHTLPAGGGTVTLVGSASDLTYPSPGSAPANINRNITALFNTAGAKSGTATFTPNAEGLAGESVQTFNVGYNANAVDNRTLSATGVAFGRVMVGQSTGSEASTISSSQLDEAATRVTLGATDKTYNILSSGGTVTLQGSATDFTYSAGNAPDAIARNVSAVFNSAGVKSGTASFTPNAEGLAGETPNAVGVGYTATAVADRSVSATTVNLGRVMVGQTSGTLNTTLSSAANDDAATRVTLGSGDRTFNLGGGAGSVTLHTGAGDFSYAPGASPASIARAVSATFNTAGAKSGSATFTPLAEGLAGESVQDIAVGYTAAAVADRTATATTVNFGRIMVGQNGNETSTFASSQIDNAATRITLNAGSTGIAVTDGTVTVNASANNFSYPSPTSAPSNFTRSVNASFTTAGLKSGSAMLTPNGEGLSGESVQDIAIGYTATAVDNRVIRAGSSVAPLAAGKVLVGQAVDFGNTAFVSPESNDMATAISFRAPGALLTNSVGTFNLGGGMGHTTYNGTTTSTNRTLSVTFAQSGNYAAGVANVDGMTQKIENLAGETLAPVEVHYSAQVWQAASLTTNTASVLSDGSSLTVSNAVVSDGGQRAAARILSKTQTGHASWSVTDLAPGTVIAAGGSAVGVAAFDPDYMLNGIHRAKVRVTLEHDDQTIQGTSGSDLGTRTWTLSKTITGNVGYGEAVVLSGESFGGFYISSGSDVDTTASFLAGTATTDVAISVDFTPGSVGDIVYLSTHGAVDPFVLQLSYDDTLMNRDENSLFLAWWTPDGWVNAILGNHGPNVGSHHFSSWADSGAGLTLGSWGVDTVNNNVWAVIDHNSAFAVIPEPASLLLLTAGGLLLTRRNRRA